MAFYTDRLTGSERGLALLAGLQGAGEATVEVTEEVLASLSETATPQGVVAVVPFPGLPWPTGGLAVVLDGLRDPGNAGTIMRAAWAAGATGLVATRGTVDLYASKVVRSAMGAHFHLPLRSGLDAGGLAALLAGRRIFLAAQQGLPYWEVDWRGDRALIIGGEARGPEVAGALAETQVAIPMMGGVESLNAAVAAGVLLFESLRQRIAGGR